MDERLIEIARRAFEVYNDDGPTGMIGFLQREKALHPDFLFHIQEDLPNGGDWPGIEGWNDMTRTWMEAWEVFTIHPHEFTPVGADRLFVPVRQRALARGSGIEIAAEMYYLLLFRDGKLAQVRLYGERERAEEAARH